MGTRGAIAVPNGDGWKGRYHHWDSYPTGLGAMLHKLHSETFGGDTARMIQVLTEEHTAWSTIYGDWSHAPGFVEDRRSNEDNPAPACYCHGDRAEEGSWIECSCPSPESTCDALFVEYAYVLTERGMFIYTHLDSGDVITETAADGRSWKSHRYFHKPIGFAPWSEPFDGEAWEAKCSLAYEENEAKLPARV